jgi:uracil-DNA glycosylase
MSALTELYEQIALCHKCDIARLRTRVVPGEGAENAEIMFIGEAPGWHEDQQGRPFVGPAGQYLDQLLLSINLKRPQVYIANVIKCRPPDNRDPLPTEIQNCAPWLESQISIIKPKMIVTLGRYSMAKYFPGKSISKIHGTAQKKGDVIHFAMYHPAAALHQQSLRQAIEADMRKIPEVLASAQEIKEEVAKEEEPPPQQLSMF